MKLLGYEISNKLIYAGIILTVIHYLLHWIGMNYLHYDAMTNVYFVSITLFISYLIVLPRVYK